MLHEKVLGSLIGASGAGTSFPMDVSPFLAGHQVSAQIRPEIDLVATVKIEGSDDGTVWTDLVAAEVFSAGENAQVAIVALPRFVRHNVTAWTSGLVSIVLESGS